MRDRGWNLGCKGGKRRFFPAMGSALTPAGTTQNNNTKECDRDGLILDGIFTHGSVECNETWLDRPASYFAVANAHTCQSLPDAEIKQYVKRGMLDFDRHVANNGKEAACRELDQLMTTIEMKIK